MTQSSFASFESETFGRRTPPMSRPHTAILVQYGGVAGGKAMMAVWGLDMGGVRLPNVSLSKEAKDDCVKRLKKIGYK